MAGSGGEEARVLRGGGLQDERPPSDDRVRQPEASRKENATWSRVFLDGFRSGDPDVLEHLYSNHLDSVIAVVRRTLQGRVLGWAERPELEDLVQEVFIRAFSAKARASYEDGRPYGPYLAAIARNLVIDTVRSDKRFHKAMVEISDDMMTSEWDPPGEWADAADQATVESYLRTLSPELAAVHHQRYVCCASQEEAARALSISRQQLRTLEKALKRGLATALATDARGRR